MKCGQTGLSIIISARPRVVIADEAIILFAQHIWQIAANVRDQR